jgi:hypothetical protein
MLHQEALGRQEKLEAFITTPGQRRMDSLNGLRFGVPYLI